MPKNKPGPHPKEMMDRVPYTEVFLEFAFRTPNDESTIGIHYADSVKLSDKNGKFFKEHLARRYKNVSEAAGARSIGLKRSELKSKIDAWHKTAFMKNESGYTKKINELLDSGFIKRIPSRVSNKNYRYILNKSGVLDKLLTIIDPSLNHWGGVFAELYQKYMVEKVSAENDTHFKLFDKFLWCDFLEFLKRIFRYRVDCLDSKSIQTFDKRKDESICSSTIKDLFEHYIFYRIFSGIHKTPLNEDMRANTYYQSFQSCCWQYILDKKNNRHLLPGTMEQPDFLIEYYQKITEKSHILG